MKDDIGTMMNDWRATLLTLGVGSIGGGVALFLSLPAPTLLGSTLAVSVLALSGQPVRAPSYLRSLAFTVIGCSLGSGMTPDFFSRAALWPMSLGLLGLVLIMIMVCSSWILIRLFGHSRETAVLSSSPGGLSFAMAMTASGIGDVQAVSMIQSLRLLFIVLGLPPLLLMASVPDGEGTWAEIPRLLTYFQVVVLFLAACLLGRIGAGRGMPAAHLFSGMIVSGGVHGLGFWVGTFPTLLLHGGFVITGTVVGSRFKGVTGYDLRRHFGAATVTIFVAMTISAAAAWLVAHHLEIPFEQVWVAYVPGGVEAMAAMALSLDLDGAFVATHHLFRILLLIVMIPFALRIVR